MQGFNKFGFNVDDSGVIRYREWAPNAKKAFLIGEFSESTLYPLQIIFLYYFRWLESTVSPYDCG